MLATLQLEIRSEKDRLNIAHSSMLQGVMMQMIDPDYAEQMHESVLHPYSQYLETGENTVWNINTLTDEAYEKIILKMQKPDFQRFHIEKKDMDVEIVKKSVIMLDERELLQEFYEKPMERMIKLEFITPTSYKSNGNYMIIPDLRLLYQSLMNKYSAVSEELEMFDEEALEQLQMHSYISEYRLRTNRFPLEGTAVPGYQGTIGVRFKGSETMARYIRLLCRFGEFSGAGIKTAMGMGALKICKEKRG